MMLARSSARSPVRGSVRRFRREVPSGKQERCLRTAQRAAASSCRIRAPSPLTARPLQFNSPLPSHPLASVGD